MLYVYHVEVEDDAAAVRLAGALTLPEDVQGNTAFSFGQGPAYLVMTSPREVTAQELSLPEGLELVLAETVTEEQIAQAATETLLAMIQEANEATDLHKLLRFAAEGEEDGEPEQGAGDGAGEPGGGEG